MTIELSTATPLTDPDVCPLIDAAFQRAGRESRLVAELARTHPDFDPGLALLAKEDGVNAGWVLFLPRAIRLRGAWVKLAISAPLAVLPAKQRRGIGRALIRCGLAALSDRKLRGAVVIGVPEFFRGLGYASAFNHYTLRVPVDALPPEGDTSAWIGLDGRHMDALTAIQRANYADVDGSEQRFAAPIEWESFAPRSHTLVCEERGTVLAFLRFRVRGEVEISECGARDPAGVAQILRFLRRLAREHRRAVVEVHIPPAHPVASSLFQHGAIVEANNIGGASLLSIVDWKGLFEDTAPAWSRALACAGAKSISLEIEQRTHRLVLRDGVLHVGSDRDPHRHLVVPDGWAPGLVTGQRTARELLFELEPAQRELWDAQGVALLSALFPGGTPMWTYAPVFEIADD